MGGLDRRRSFRINCVLWDLQMWPHFSVDICLPIKIGLLSSDFSTSSDISLTHQICVRVSRLSALLAENAWQVTLQACCTSCCAILSSSQSYTHRGYQIFSLFYNCRECWNSTRLFESAPSTHWQVITSRTAGLLTTTFLWAPAKVVIPCQRRQCRHCHHHLRRRRLTKGTTAISTRMKTSAMTCHLPVRNVLAGDGCWLKHRWSMTLGQQCLTSFFDVHFEPSWFQRLHCNIVEFCNKCSTQTELFSSICLVWQEAPSRMSWCLCKIWLYFDGLIL